MTADRYRDVQEIAGNVSRETFDSLVDLEGLLHKWNAHINLVAPSTISESWQRHILDSLQLWPHLRDVSRIADIGSGGGFPGLVLGVLLKDRPGGSIKLIESNRKKAAFLQNAIGQLKIPATTIAERIEKVVLTQPAPQIITARALAPLGGLLELTELWFKSGARGLFHKGRDYQREIEESTDKWQFDLVIHPSRIDAHSVVLEVSNVARL